MPSLTEILQKLWAGMPGLVGLFMFLVTLGIFIAVSAWEQSARRADALRAEKERNGAKSPPEPAPAPPPPAAPEPVGAGRERPGSGS